MSTIRTMENDRLIVEVSDHGAELIRIYDKDKKQEVLWDADPKFWNRHAPILFPFVGKVAGGTYRHAGTEYEMRSQHGFARDTEFDFVSDEGGKICHVLSATDETRKIYPFSFRFENCYELKENKIVVRHVVTNEGAEDMYFSVGGHPAFRVPPKEDAPLKDVKRSDYSLAFGKKEKLSFLHIHESLGLAFTDKPYELPMKDGRCVIADDMFDHDALIFDDYQIEEMSILNPDGTPYVTVNCEGFPFVGIWSKPGAPFVCLEPWLGRTDDYGFTGELKEKKCIAHLAPGQTRTVEYTIEIG